MSRRWQPVLVSVVVPTYNRGDLLLRVLTGFGEQTLPAERYEVVVVDDGGTDGTAERAEEHAAGCGYRLRVVRQANRGPAAARNAGLRAATGEVVVFVDDDCVPVRGLLAAHLAAHAVEGLAVIGRMVWHPEITTTPFQRFVGEHIFTYAHITLPFDAPFNCYYTGNASVHRASALAIGGFDETFPYAMHEDIEFAYRLRKHGVRFVFAPDAVVLHYRREGLRPFLSNQRGKGREMVRLLRKHPELHAYAPLTWSGDPAVTERYVRASLDFFQLLGIQAALGQDEEGLAPDEAPLAGPERAAVMDERVVALTAEAAALRAELAETRGAAEWVTGLAREHARLERAYAEQATRAAGLERRLADRGWRGLLDWWPRWSWRTRTATRSGGSRGARSEMHG